MEWVEEIDEMGTWLVNGNTRISKEASAERIAKQKEIEENATPPEPTQEDYMMDLDYRLSLIELGL